MDADLTFYALRHKATGHFMPTLRGRGYSHWAPTADNPKFGIDEAFDVPRLFATAKGADNARVLWAQGERRRTWVNDGLEGGHDEVQVEDVGRKKDDLEVVPMQLTPADRTVLHIKFSQQDCVALMRKAFERTLAEFQSREDPTVTHYVPFNPTDGDFDWDQLHTLEQHADGGDYELTAPWVWRGITLPQKEAA